MNYITHDTHVFMITLSNHEKLDRKIKHKIKYLIEFNLPLASHVEISFSGAQLKNLPYMYSSLLTHMIFLGSY